MIGEGHDLMLRLIAHSEDNTQTCLLTSVCVDVLPEQAARSGIYELGPIKDEIFMEDWKLIEPSSARLKYRSNKDAIWLRSGGSGGFDFATATVA